MTITSNGKGMRILLLEDNDNVVYSIINIAKRLGYSILQTQDFSEADYWIDSDPKLDSFDYLIVDLSIPCVYMDYFSKEEYCELEDISKDCKLSGWIWLKRLCKKYPDAKRKIIVLSAFLTHLPESEKSIYGSGIIFFEKARTETVTELNKLLSES